jgi:hypothetical protein
MALGFSSCHVSRKGPPTAFTIRAAVYLNAELSTLGSDFIRAPNKESGILK